MTQLARAAQIRNVLLCTLTTLTLAACGGESGSSSAAATSAESDTATALVPPNAGTIDRSQGIDATGNTSSGATPSPGGTVASTTAPKTAATTPASGSGTTTGTTGTTTVVTGSKATTPVKVITSNGVATLDWMPPTQN